MLRIFFHKYQRAIFFSRLLLYNVIYTTGGVLYLKLKWPLLLIYMYILYIRMKKNTIKIRNSQNNYGKLCF
jgi:hypothetical protein